MPSPPPYKPPKAVPPPYNPTSSAVPKKRSVVTLSLAIALTGLGSICILAGLFPVEENESNLYEPSDYVVFGLITIFGIYLFWRYYRARKTSGNNRSKPVFVNKYPKTKWVGIIMAAIAVINLVQSCTDPFIAARSTAWSYGMLVLLALTGLFLLRGSYVLSKRPDDLTDSLEIMKGLFRSLPTGPKTMLKWVAYGLCGAFILLVIGVTVFLTIDGAIRLFNTVTGGTPGICDASQNFIYALCPVFYIISPILPPVFVMVIAFIVRDWLKNRRNNPDDTSQNEVSDT